MNQTNFEHMAFGAIMQFIVGFILLAAGIGYGWAFTVGGCIAGAFFFAREYAQVEYKIRARSGKTLTELMPWDVLQPDEWTKDGIIDFVGVWVVCGSITLGAWTDSSSVLFLGVIGAFVAVLFWAFKEADLL